MYASYKIIIEIYYSHILVLCLQTLVWVLIPSTSQCEPVRFQCLITTWGDEWLLYQAALSNVKKNTQKAPLASLNWLQTAWGFLLLLTHHVSKRTAVPSVPTVSAPPDSSRHQWLCWIFTVIACWFQLPKSMVCGPHPAELLQRFSAAQCFLQTHWPLSFGELVAAWSALNALTSLLVGLPWEFFLSYDSSFHSVLYSFCPTHPPS